MRHKCLVAHEHAVSETAVSKNLGRTQMPLSKPLPRIVYKVGLAVYHAGKVVVHGGVGKFLKHIAAMERIACVKENHILTRCHSEALVHGVVNAAVGFRYHSAQRVGVGGGYGESIVLRGSVNDYVFVQTAGLGIHTFKGGPYGAPGVEAYGDY
jgi:hypothetical protein